MTMPVQNPPVARKVKAATGGATIGTTAAGLIVWALQYYVFKGHMDPVLQIELYAGLPGVLGGAAAFVAGYMTKHGVRDLPMPTAEQAAWMANYIETHLGQSPQGHVQFVPGGAIQVTGGPTTGEAPQT